MLPALLFGAILALTVVADDPTNSPATDAVDGANSACPPNWQSYNNRCFYYDSTPKNWAQAEANCQMLGGNLASIQSSDEHAFIQGLTVGSAPSWLGGSACQLAGSWFWSDGKPFGFKSWCPSQPDNTLSACCLQMNSQVGKCWDDVPCNGFLPSVCEKNP